MTDFYKIQFAIYYNFPTELDDEGNIIWHVCDIAYGKSLPDGGVLVGHVYIDITNQKSPYVRLMHHANFDLNLQRTQLITDTLKMFAVIKEE